MGSDTDTENTGSTCLLADELSRLIGGYRATCVLVAALRVGVIERLASGPIGEADLAAALGAHGPSLTRLLRALRVLGLVERHEDGTRLTAMGRLLCDGEHPLRDLAVLVGEEYLPAWAELGRSVLSGEPAFDGVFGRSVWADRGERPELNESFQRVLAAQHVPMTRALVAAYDFSAHDVIVDVGGGNGTVLAGILASAPRSRGVLLDQPYVVQEAADVLEAAGVLNRCRTVGGSFFDEVPRDGDLYILQHILHDWDDARCLSILRRCRAAMKDSSRLLVIEHLIPEESEPSARLVLLDLHMMAVLGGQERTRSDYRALLRSAGFAVERCIPTEAGVSLVESYPDP